MLKALRKMGGSVSPCASCKLLRRRCAKDCIFAPYFPSEDPQRFAIVHKIFGASNLSKFLQELPANQRADAVSSMVYEASARIRDPVYGCVGAISYLQTQVSQLQMQLKEAQAEVLSIKMQQQQQILVQVDDTENLNYDERSLIFPINNSNHNYNYNLRINNMQQQSYVNVIQEPPKRESLWT